MDCRPGLGFRSTMYGMVEAACQHLCRVRQDLVSYSPTSLDTQEGRYVDSGCHGDEVKLQWCLPPFMTRSWYILSPFMVGCWQGKLFITIHRVCRRCVVCRLAMYRIAVLPMYRHVSLSSTWLLHLRIRWCIFFKEKKKLNAVLKREGQCHDKLGLSSVG
jgi:hypothetical protein